MSQSSPWLRNLLILFIVIQVAPGAFKTAKRYYEEAISPKQKVGVLTIKEVISDSTAHVGYLKEFMEEKEIAAIVLKIDSPGGAPGASQALYEAIRTLKEQHRKPVIVWVQNICASGGYYVAAAGDWIVATPSAIIGSIGVKWTQFNLEKLREQYNVGYQEVHAGSFKTTTDMFVQTTAAQTAMLQNVVDGVYNRFVADVRAARPQLIEDHKIWADARIFNGDEALQRKLIDELGSQLTVEAAVKRLANINLDIEWVRPSRKPSWMKLFSSEDAGDDDKPYVMQALAREICLQLGLTTPLASQAPTLM